MICDNFGDLYLVTTYYPLVGLAHSLWHNPSSSALESFHSNEFISYKHLNSRTICVSCVFRKHVRLPFVSSNNFTMTPFDILHSDSWTSSVLSSANHHYYVLFLDDFSNFMWTFPPTNKSQVFEIFTSLSNQICTQFSQIVKCFQCDNGREYDNISFYNYCASNGLTFLLSFPHTSS